MSATTDSLERALAELENVLAGPGAGLDARWAKGAALALAVVEQAVQQHTHGLEPPEGRVVELDRPAIPSPGLDRRLAGLQEELDGLRQEAAALRRAAQAGPTHARDLAALWRRTAALRDALARAGRQEAELVQESVTLDLGAGD
jgi:hypothetical protein